MINSRAGSVGVLLAILLSLAGLVLSGLLLADQARLATDKTPIMRSLCERFGPHFGCDEALTNKWSRQPFWKSAGRQIPTGLLGVIFFAATTSWFLIVGRPSGSRYGWHWIAFAMTVVGAVFAAYLAWVMVKRMNTLCPLCAAVQATAGLLLLVTLLIWPRRRQVEVMGEPVSGPLRGPISVYVPAPDYPPARTLPAWLLATAAISAVGWFGYNGMIRCQTPAPVVTERPSTDGAGTQAADCKAQVEKLTAEVNAAKAATAEAQSSLQDTQARLKDYEDDYQAVWFNYSNEPLVDIPVEPGDSIRGKVDALHTIVMYMDLQCPYCRAADKLLNQKLAKYPEQLRLVVKHFPLNKDCNEQVSGKAHSAACAAAVTVEAARAIGGEEAFWKMYDELFAHQAEFPKSPKEFVQQACERIGIDNDALWKKINSTSVWNRINEQCKQAGSIGVQATPAVYYDGRKVAGWQNSKFWDFLVWQAQRQGGQATKLQATQPSPSSQP